MCVMMVKKKKKKSVCHETGVKGFLEQYIFLLISVSGVLKLMIM